MGTDIRRRLTCRLISGMLKSSQVIVQTDHINSLCRTFGLDKFYVTSDEAASVWIDERMLWVPKVEGPISYYVSLHEIGHFVTDHLSVNKLEKEAHAWNWALKVGKTGATKPVYSKIMRCLNRYVKISTNLDFPDNFTDLLSLAKNKAKV